MPKFIMIYKGEATDPMAMTQEEREAVMGKWAAWMENLGPALADIGTPFGPGASVVDDGSKGAPVPLSGYSIVDAADLNAAMKYAKDHPFLSDGSGKFAIDIFEMMPVPM